MFASLTGCTTFKQPSEQEKLNVSEMTSDMRTWALGRGLIDLPANWTGSGDVKLYYGLDANHSTVEVQVVGEGVTQQRFDEALQERASRIAAVKNPRLNNISMLVSAKGETRQRILLQYFASNEVTDTFVHEFHLLVDDAYVMLRAESYNGNIAPVVARLKKLSREIFKVAPSNAGAGFALASIVIRSNHDQEIATFRFRPPVSNVALEVYINALSPSETKSMSARAEEGAQIFLADDYENLRTRNITLAGMPAEESLIGFSDDTHRQILFGGETYRDNPSLSRPFMSFSLSAGGIESRPRDPNAVVDLVRRALPEFANRGYKLPLWQRPASRDPVNPSLTDYEAIAVWDAILKSVRIRFNSVAVTPDPYTHVRVPRAQAW
ncbi:T6SS immunity protein Tli4 family protein [Pseudomonas sp. NPDC087626]|uniref:T6SS immunity protein Tli4 family protein n=1 Tax=Pseudomonas sp. NPDC087626 TaxID=3364444 RepID=UPI00381993AA